MSIKSQISSTFSTAGPLPATLLTKLSALSSTLSLSPSQLYESWEAHSLTRGVDALNEGTFSAFDTHLKNGAAKSNKIGGMAVNTNTALGKRSGSTAGVTPSPATKKQEMDRSGLSAVDSLSATPSKGAVTPSKAPGSVGSATVTPQPKTPNAATYSNRKGRGETLLTFNPNLPSVTSDGRRKCTISSHPLHAGSDGNRHGFSPLVSRAKALEERWQRMNSAICEKYGLKSEEEEMAEIVDRVQAGQMEIDDQGEKAYWTPVGVPGQCGVVCVGRVCNEVSPVLLSH